MLSHEVLPEGIEHDHVRVAFDLLAECVCEPGKPSHARPYGEVRSLGIGGADMLWIGVPGDFLGPCPDAI